MGYNINIAKFILIWIGCLFAGFGCQNECEKYKQAACSDKNSTLCHEAMQKIPDISSSECTEKIMIINSELKLKK
ncbi:MAG: hypothetical protein OEV78_03925 [Spirochaetia bacterium]|nr:hypothetical protein [Spirochaetia bacterium]